MVSNRFWKAKNLEMRFLVSIMGRICDETSQSFCEHISVSGTEYVSMNLRFKKRRQRIGMEDDDKKIKCGLGFISTAKWCYLFSLGVCLIHTHNTRNDSLLFKPQVCLAITWIVRYKFNTGILITK